MLNFTKRVVQAWNTDNVISFTAFQGPQPLLSQLNLTWLIWLSLSLSFSLCPPYRIQQGVATAIPFSLISGLWQSVQARIHTDFHRFTEIGQIFHNKY